MPPGGVVWYDQVMLSVAPEDEAAGVTSLSGNLAREKEETKSFKTDSDHLQNLGVMIEAMENTIRSDMDGERAKTSAYVWVCCVVSDACSKGDGFPSDPRSIEGGTTLQNVKASFASLCCASCVKRITAVSFFVVVVIFRAHANVVVLP